MKNLYEKYTKEQLHYKYLSNPFKVTKNYYGAKNNISTCKEDLELIKSFIAEGKIVQRTAKEITEKFVSDAIWLFTLDGKIINLEDWDFDLVNGKEKIILYGEWFGEDDLFFSEIILDYDEVVNVFYSNEPEPITNKNLDEDLKWLLT